MAEGLLLYMRINQVMLMFTIILSALMLADFITTNYALSVGIHEGNGFMNLIVQNLYLFSAVKIIGTATIIMVYIKTYQANKTVSKIGMFIIISIMSGVVMNNVLVILRGM